MNRTLLREFLRNKAAVASFAVLLLIVVVAIVGPSFIDASTNRPNLRLRLLPPFGTEHGWLYILGADSLGRSMITRLILGARTTLAISVTTVVLSLAVGTAIGIFVGLRETWYSQAMMRAIDVLMSIPSLLLAMVVLYTLGAHPLNVILILSITRLPMFARTARAEALEVRERNFVRAARVLGGKDLHVLRKHLLPMVLPSLLAIAALELSVVMLAESTLTFLGIGIQAPDLTWGLMVAEGREYLTRGWWVAFWPGCLISMVAVTVTILGNWLRVSNDPTLRTRIGTATADAH